MEGSRALFNSDGSTLSFYKDESLMLLYVMSSPSMLTMIELKKLGLKRVYRWLPNTAADTSKPLPTLPWAKQWINCATLWIKILSSALESEAAPICVNKAPTSEVVKAAELPNPVLCTEPKVLCVLQKGSKDASASAVFGNWRFDNCGMNVSHVGLTTKWCFPFYLSTLRIEIIVAYNRNLETLLQILVQYSCSHTLLDHLKAESKACFHKLVSCWYSIPA